MKSEFICGECKWVGPISDMKNESDFGYDQSCCPICNDVMFDDINGLIYCEKYEPGRTED